MRSRVLRHARCHVDLHVGALERAPVAVARLARQPVARARRPAHRREAVLGEQLLELGVVRREELVQYAVGGEGQLVLNAVLAQRAQVARALLAHVHRAREVRVVRLLDLEGVRRELQKVRDGLLGVVGIWGVSSSGLLGEVSIWRVDE